MFYQDSEQVPQLRKLRWNAVRVPHVLHLSSRFAQLYSLRKSDIQSNPLFPQGFQTGKPLAFCGWLAQKGVPEDPLFLIFQQLVPGLKTL